MSIAQLDVVYGATFNAGDIVPYMTYGIQVVVLWHDTGSTRQIMHIIIPDYHYLHKPLTLIAH